MRQFWIALKIHHGRRRHYPLGPHVKQSIKHAATDRKVLRRLAYVLLALAKPCTDCGHYYGADQMEFDHLPQYVKLFSPREVCNRSLTAIKTEIAKCEIVCCECHQKREVARGRTHHNGTRCPNYLASTTKKHPPSPIKVEFARVLREARSAPCQT